MRHWMFKPTIIAISLTVSILAFGSIPAKEEEKRPQIRVNSIERPSINADGSYQDKYVELLQSSEHKAPILSEEFIQARVEPWTYIVLYTSVLVVVAIGSICYIKQKQERI